MASQTLTLSTWAARRRPDEDIFDRTLRGDPVAFSEVYRRYQKRIYGFCLARSLDPGTAADATQEVFMRLLRADPGSIESPQAWLFTVARNVVIDVARKRTRTPEDAAADDDTLAWDRLKAADTADEVLSRSDARDVFLALRSLRPRYRTALIMREVHGESAKDMADALETTPGAVDTLVSRARDAFGAAYASVGDLPSACRANIELIYRNHGTGITPEEHAAMDAHVAGCERCQAEAKKADDPRHLAALLPFLVPARLLGRGLIERAALTVRTVPDAVLQHAPVVLSQPQTWHLGAKIAAGLLAAALITAPVVATTIDRAPSKPANRPVSAQTTPNAPSPGAMASDRTLMHSGGTWRTMAPSTLMRGSSAGSSVSGTTSTGMTKPTTSSMTGPRKASGGMSSGSKTGTTSGTSGRGTSMGSGAGGM
jgi:RNA polymerase sigma-70 factor (ECF subfamily)